MNNQLQTPKGFRDFLPEEARERNAVGQIIKKTFELFGFEPLETPTIEYASVLLGKYGEEADKLIFRFKDKGDRDVALRYDQTVPTARVLSEYKNILPKYFRRYQMQNVFRAEKPQKGRYREFTQCDIDIFGSTSPLADAEIVSCTYTAFKNLGFFDVRIKLNDRAVLMSTIKPFETEIVSIYSIIQTIDKLEKIGESGVIEELTKKGVSENEASKILSAIAKAEPTDNLREIIKCAQKLGVPGEALQFSPALARGLDYYTGMIFEVTLNEFKEGSVCGGGRYDNLIEQLGGTAIPAVGMAIGFDRTVEAFKAVKQKENKSSSTILVTVFDKTCLSFSLETAKQLRDAGISAEIFPSFDKLEKQLKYADQKQIPYVLIQGPDEVKKEKIQLKNMNKRTSETIQISDLVNTLKQLISKQ